jgi:hypothetical protein
MSLVLALYLADVAGGLGAFAVFFTIVFFVASAAFLVHHLDTGSKDLKSKRRSQYSLLAALVCSAIAIVTPSKETAYLMIGAQAAENIAASPQAKELTDKIFTVISGKLDDLAEEK